jgi:acetyl-CoA C-acetyltransferase
MSEDRTPVLIGAGQITQKEVEPSEAREPVELMAEAARRAAGDAGLRDGALAALDQVAVVNVLAWACTNPPRLLSERLGARPRREIYTTVGGNTPQWLVTRAARDIAAGKSRCALIAGAEAIATLKRAQKAGVRLAWSAGGGGAPEVLGEPREGTSAEEVAHGLQLPTQIYPIFENALRARRGLSLAEHRALLGRLCSRFSEVAAANPYAWFRDVRSPAEISTVGPRNRMVAFPYPKLMNAILEVDQGAALLLTSASFARELGVAADRWVYLLGTADAHDHWLVSERVDYVSSPAIRAAGRTALAAAGLSIAEVDFFDLYSCFPCAVQIARDELGIPDDDRRALTVTGGLACFGGPGNAYSLHAIAAMMERLRSTPGSHGLVSALGWYLTKHSIGVYGTTPPADGFSGDGEPSDAALQRTIDREPHPELCHEPAGRATVETYTVLHDREGAPVRGIVVGRLDDGRRFLANTPDDRDVLAGLVAREAVGLSGRVSHAGGASRFDLT